MPNNYPEHNLIIVDKETLIVEVQEQGPPGIQGPQGDLGVEVPFDFGDATPKNIVIVLANKLIYTAKIGILTPFNGISSTLSLGDAGNPQRLIQTSEVDPYAVATYETSPLYKYGIDTQIILTINQGIGCTQGSGIVVLTFQS